MKWSKDVVQRTVEGAGEYPGVQLHFLLQRLEAHPDCVPAIADAIRDMGQWYLAHAAELERYGREKSDNLSETGRDEGTS